MLFVFIIIFKFYKICNMYICYFDFIVKKIGVVGRVRFKYNWFYYIVFFYIECDIVFNFKK